MHRSCAAVAALVALSGAAQADVIDFVVYENASNADVSGLVLQVELLDGGSFVDMRFTNSSTISAVVTAVYVESTDAINGLLLNGRIADESSGVDFSDGATPPNPAQPGHNYGGAWSGNLYSADADAPPPRNGINEVGNESLTLRFDYGGGADFDAILAQLTGGNPGFRLAQHVQGLPNDASVWTTTVPAPGGACIAAIAGLLACRRRR